jgi:mannonate dehydratase
MKNRLTRRTILQALPGIAAAAATPLASARDIPALNLEGPGIPKICLEMGNGALAAGRMDPAGMRRVKQLGVNHVATGGPRLPWDETALRAMMSSLAEGGLTLGNLMMGGFPNTLYGRPGRDEEIESVKQSIRAAGRVGLPVIEYNFYAHRAIEGYYEDVDTERRREMDIF